MSIIDIKGVRIGEGMPKICLPIVGHTQYEITSQAMTIASLKPDIVEFRADWYDEAKDSERLIEMLTLVRTLVDNTPILFTFRTKEEGGIQEADANEYISINKMAIKSGLVDLIDIELMAGLDTINEIMQIARDNKIIIVMSNHDFNETPSVLEMVQTLEKMIKLGADIPKIAVMPTNNKDVLNLLEATDIIHTSHPYIPIVTMSMEGRGIISRISGEIFGSSITFGSARKASAPGQIEAGNLSNVLKVINRNLY